MKVNLPQNVGGNHLYNLIVFPIKDKYVLIIYLIWDHDIGKLPEGLTFQQGLHILWPYSIVVTIHDHDFLLGSHNIDLYI